MDETPAKHLREDLKPYVWKKGQSGNPNGRPKGKTLKEFARDYLKNLPDDEKIEYLKTLPSEIVWKMAEGNPETKTDVTSNGKDLFPQPILDVTNKETHRGAQAAPEQVSQGEGVREMDEGTPS